MVDSKHQWKAWLYLLPAVILLLIFTVWPIINTVVTAFIYDVDYQVAEFQAEPAENGYRFYRINDADQKEYLQIGSAETGSAVLQYTTDSGSVFTYQTEYAAWIAQKDGTSYFLGATADSQLDVFAITEESAARIGVSLYAARLLNASDRTILTEGFQEKVNYRMEVFKGTEEAFVYAVSDTEQGYISATKILDSAAKIYGDQGSNSASYKLYFKNDAKEKFYIDLTADDAGTICLQYAAATECEFSYRQDSEAWVCTRDGVDFYLALDTAANRIGIYRLEDRGTSSEHQPAAIISHRGEASEPKYMTGKLTNGMSYRIGAYRQPNGTRMYVTNGNDPSGIGVKLTDNINGDSVSKVGIHNFVEVLTHKGSDFMVCLKNTLILTVITVPISTVLALLIAVALNSIKPFQKILQTIFFLPYVTNSIAIGMVFAAMFNIVGLTSSAPSYGIINNILGLFGVEPINWINQGAPAWASFTALIIYIVWNALPFKILILLGGLQSINKQYYDAAKIDSTPKWRVLTRITVPLLSPMLTYVVITSFIGGFKEYSSVVGIFGDSKAVPGGANMNTIVGHIQNHLTKTRDYGLAGAAALMLFVIIFIVTMINLRISKKNTHY